MPIEVLASPIQCVNCNKRNERSAAHNDGLCQECFDAGASTNDDEALDDGVTVLNTIDLDKIPVEKTSANSNVFALAYNKRDGYAENYSTHLMRNGPDEYGHDQTERNDHYLKSGDYKFVYGTVDRILFRLEKLFPPPEKDCILYEETYYHHHNGDKLAGKLQNITIYKMPMYTGISKRRVMALAKKYKRVMVTQDMLYGGKNGEDRYKRGTRTVFNPPFYFDGNHVIRYNPSRAKAADRDANAGKFTQCVAYELMSAVNTALRDKFPAPEQFHHWGMFSGGAGYRASTAVVLHTAAVGLTLLLKMGATNKQVAKWFKTNAIVVAGHVRKHPKTTVGKALALACRTLGIKVGPVKKAKEDAKCPTQPNAPSPKPSEPQGSAS